MEDWLDKESFKFKQQWMRVRELGINPQVIVREDGTHSMLVDLTQIPEDMDVEEFVKYVNPDYIAGIDPYETENKE